MAEATAPRPGGQAEPDDQALGGAWRNGGAQDAADGGATVEEFAASLRSDHAGSQRRRESWLRRQAADDATVAAALMSLAERGATVAVTTRTGNRHVGRLSGAGSDLVLLDGHGGRVAITVESIDSFQAHADDRATPRRFEPIGHRRGADATTLLEFLALVVADRPDVTIVTRSGTRHSGELVAAGVDVVMVRPADGGALTYAPAASLSEVLLPASTGSG